MKTNGKQCILCDALVEHEEQEVTRPLSLEDCTVCGEIACMTPALITTCELGRDCEDEDHHYGHDCHVKELDQ